jgi:tetratricopeptide (TPR) repeat protein
MACILEIMHRIWKTLLRKKKALLCSILAIAVLFAFLTPWTSQAIGNVLFGQVPSLYNVNLAQFFFSQSSYPIVGKAAPYAHYQLSRTYFIKGSFVSAAAEAQKELDLYPDHVRTYYILGLTYGYLHEEEQAIDAFSKFIESSPMSWAARNDKAWLQFRIGDIDGALATIQPVAHDTENAWVQNTYGALLMNKKRYAEAKKAFTYAKIASDKMDPSDWGKNYPGNDPRVYETGLDGMKLSIDNNLKLIASVYK